MRTILAHYPKCNRVEPEDLRKESGSVGECISKKESSGGARIGSSLYDNIEVSFEIAVRE